MLVKPSVRKYGEDFVHLAYLDDSDTKAKLRKWQVMTAVVIQDQMFKFAEMTMVDLPTELMGEKLGKFEEFHACELYGGHGPFEGIDQEQRFDAIEKLLSLLKAINVTVMYGAVDLEDLKSQIYGSADPVDVCFRTCLGQVQQWADERVNDQISFGIREDPENYEKVVEYALPAMLSSLVILVVDECDSKIKNTLQKSFRSLRPKNSTLRNCFHDDMYFGDSRYSIGIQLADLCSYFIARHLEGDRETEAFYEIIREQIWSKGDSKDDGEAKLRSGDAEDSKRL